MCVYERVQVRKRKSLLWMASQAEWSTAADKVNCHLSAPITARPHTV